MTMVTLSGKAVTLSQGDGLAWFWACGLSDVDYMGDTIPLGSQWNELIGSAIEYAEVFRPPMIEYHNHDSRPIGRCERMRVLTRADAVALGVEQEHDEALYIGVRLNATGLAADNAGELIYSSLGFCLDWADEDGRVWPMAIKEFSAVPVPHLKRGQVPRSALRQIQLSDHNGGHMAEDMPPENGGAMESLQTQLDALAARVEDMFAALQSMQSAPVEAADEAADEKEDEEDATVAELRAQVNAMRAQLADADAERAVASVEAERVVTKDGRVALKAMYLSDSKAFSSVVSMLAQRPKTTPRIAGAGVSAGKTLGERAQEIAREKGVQFSAALALAASEGFVPGGQNV